VLVLTFLFFLFYLYTLCSFFRFLFVYRVYDFRNNNNKIKVTPTISPADKRLMSLNYRPLLFLLSEILDKAQY